MGNMLARNMMGRKGFREGENPGEMLGILPSMRDETQIGPPGIVSGMINQPVKDEVETREPVAPRFPRSEPAAARIMAPAQRFGGIGSTRRPKRNRAFMNPGMMSRY